MISSKPSDQLTETLKPKENPICSTALTLKDKWGSINGPNAKAPGICIY